MVAQQHGSLPEDGELQLGSVKLPAGRRVTPDEGHEPVAWVTLTDVPNAGLIWSALSDLHSETGLVPILLDGSEFEDDFFFYWPCNVSDIDGLNAAELLATRWNGDPEPDADGPSLPFPGLAPAVDAGLSTAERMAALASIGPARVGLVPCARTADVLATVGWSVFDDPAYDDEIRNALWIGAILRSWETRFGAKLLNVGPGAEIRLLVERPPKTLEIAEKIAVEHHAFCDECAGQGLRAVSEIAAALVNAPFWTFWWD